MAEDAIGQLTVVCQVYYFYSYGTAAWMTMQAAPMIASPTMIVALLSPEVREATSMHQAATTIASPADVAQLSRSTSLGVSDSRS